MSRDRQVEGLTALVLTVSDGVVAGTREDRSGEAVEERLTTLGFEVARAVTADEPDQIGRLVQEAADGGTRLIVTSGGTGLGPRDRTPEGVTPVGTPPAGHVRSVPPSVWPLMGPMTKCQATSPGARVMPGHSDGSAR